MPWQRLDSVTLASPAISITGNTFEAKKFLQTLVDVTGSSGAPGTNYDSRFNGDTGNNYSFRRSSNGGSENNSVTQNKKLAMLWTDVNDWFSVEYIINISTEEKLCILHVIEQDAPGTANPPGRHEQVSKWTNTVNQITEESQIMDNVITFNTDSDQSIIGTD